MEKICVAVRVRPPAAEEASNATHWRVEKNSISLQNALGAISGLSFAFDHVFDQNCKNERVYELLTKDMIQAVVEGFNGTAFAYGQTSSGKTFTMNGSENDPGIIHLAVNDIFRNIQMMNHREFLIRVSYMEIYNEEINDLLAPENGRLQIHECLERGIYVAGLREEIVNVAEQVLTLIERGEVNRHVGKTNMNIRSSRSHTIFRMVIESKGKDVSSGDISNTDAIRVSVLNLVDLAGSERIAKTGAGGVRLKEGKHINKSLMVLGNVINKLSDGAKQRGHIPYRDSKLTRILQPALGGNAKTSIICTVAPEEVHVEETRGTLQFASRAKRITNCVQMNEILTDSALLKRQKLEIEDLRKKLQGSHSEVLEQEILKLRNAMLKYQVEREKLAMELEEERKSHKESDQCIKEQQMKINDLNNLVNYSDANRNSSQSISYEGSFPHRLSLDSLNQGRVSISQSYNEEHYNDYCISQGEASKTPCLKSISNDFVTRRSNYSRIIDSSPISNNFDSSPISNNFANISEDDTWFRLNKGHTTDLDSLLATPDRNYQSLPPNNISAGKPIDYYEEEALKKRLDAAIQEKEELERIHKNQLVLNNQLIAEISELQQESLLILGIPQRMSESVGTCKDAYREILANMKSFAADENSLNGKLLSSISDIGISLFSTLEAHFSQVMDGHKKYSGGSTVIQEQQKVLAEKLKDTVTTLVSSQDTNAKDKCTFDFEGLASREEADATWKEQLMNELDASKERYDSLERECNLNNQFLQVSKERCNGLERECNLWKEKQASLVQDLSKSTQNLALFTAQNEKSLKDLNVEVQRRKDLEGEIRRFGETFDRRHSLLTSFHGELKDKIEKLRASTSISYPKFMCAANRLLRRYPIENKWDGKESLLEGEERVSSLPQMIQL